jgi:hypothetical protein
MSMRITAFKYDLQAVIQLGTNLKILLQQMVCAAIHKPPFHFLITAKCAKKVNMLKNNYT